MGRGGYGGGACLLRALLPTWRLLLLVLAALVPLALTDLAPGIGVLTPLLLLGVVALLVVDVARHGRTRSTGGRAGWSRSGSRSAPRTRSTLVAAESRAAPARLRLRDEHPVEFRASQTFLAGTVAARRRSFACATP